MARKISRIRDSSSIVGARRSRVGDAWIGVLIGESTLGRLISILVRGFRSCGGPRRHAHFEFASFHGQLLFVGRVLLHGHELERAVSLDEHLLATGGRHRRWFCRGCFFVGRRASHLKEGRRLRFGKLGRRRFLGRVGRSRRCRLSVSGGSVRKVDGLRLVFGDVRRRDHVYYFAVKFDVVLVAAILVEF